MQIGHLSGCNSKDGGFSVRVNDEGLPLQTQCSFRIAVRWKFTKSFDFLPLDLRLFSYSPALQFVG